MTVVSKNILSLLIFIDRFSRWAEAFLLEKDPTSDEVLEIVTVSDDDFDGGTLANPFAGLDEALSREIMKFSLNIAVLELSISAH